MDEINNADQAKCGVIMPISEIDGCDEQHWREVKSIVFEVITNAGFKPDLVSDAEDIGIIQKRIIQNIYQNPLIVCDVSGKNPNVMFELGLRLAFDKPTIIIKDDKTNYSFDTAQIEHLTYPRDLRYLKIIEFREKLKSKILGTYDKSQNDSTYTTFLKNFGEFTIPKLDTKEVSKEDFIIEELRDLKRQIVHLGRRQRELFYSDNIPHRDPSALCRVIDREIFLYIKKERGASAQMIYNYLMNEIQIKYSWLISGFSNSTLQGIITSRIDKLLNNEGPTINEEATTND